MNICGSFGNTRGAIILELSRKQMAANGRNCVLQSIENKQGFCKVKILLEL